MFIPVNEPLISSQSKKYVLDCLQSGWISAAGSYVHKFEQQFAEYLGTKHAVSVTNGTAALHLACAALDIGPGDEVIMPDLTIISCAFAVTYLGATPVFVDVDAETGNIDPSLIEAKISPRTKAIMVVHLYGHPVQMDKVKKIAQKYQLPIIEDAAEAHGAEYQGQKVGSIGEIGCFSFYANKIVTTGEGGMVVTNSDQIHQKLLLLKDLAHSPQRRFYHEAVGFNYRMTALQAALGLGELENIDKYVQKKRQMAQLYHQLLKNNRLLELPTETKEVFSVYWMYAVRMKKDAPISRDELMMKLEQAGIQTRPFFFPLHAQPVLKTFHTKSKYPISEDLSARGFYLPSGLALTAKQIQRVAEVLNNIGNLAKK